MNTSAFSCSEVRTPTKARTEITEFSLNSLCSSVKKTIPFTHSSMGGNNAAATNTSTFAFDFNGKTDRSAASGSASSAANATASSAAATGTTTTTTTSGSSSLSYLSSNMDMFQSKIEYLERERVELAMQLHKRDEKDRDRKLRLEKLESQIKHAEDERTRALQDLQKEREQVVRIEFEMEELRGEMQRVQRDAASATRCETMDVWKKMTTTAKELKRCEDELAISQNERAALTTEYNRLQQENEECKQRESNLETQVVLLQTDLRIAREKLQETVRDISISEIEREKLVAELAAQSEESEREILALREERDNALAHNAVLQEQVDQQSALSQRTHAEEQRNFADGVDANEDTLSLIKELKKKLYESELKRRKLHNQVQDLRGNVRVFVRCRPFLANDGETGVTTTTLGVDGQTAIANTADAGEHLFFHDDDCSLSLSNPGSAKPHAFSFDRVFRAASTQEEVYKEVSELVQSVMDGYRVCVFSYGQTGSGKTHTMTGLKHGEERGLIPRSIEELLDQSQTLIEQGWEVSLSLSIVELYNEELRDLLCVPNSPSSSALALKSNFSLNNDNKKKEFKIVKQDGKVVVSGLSSHALPTDNLEEGLDSFYKLLDISSQTRATACTGMNETSSRSHLIVMIDVVGSFQVPGKGTTKTLHGGLRLCDLAGSERLDRTNTLHDAARLKETVNINKSLSCLADVFLALSNKTSHVPYRNSKLTMLLQDCLSGDGKSLMFVNVSPTVASAPETLCSLRFANQVSQVELGKAQKHVVTTVFQQLPPPPVQQQQQQAAQQSVYAPPAAAERAFSTAAVGPTAAVAAAATPLNSAQSVSQFHPALQHGPGGPIGAMIEPSTPRPDRVKMRSSSFNAKLLQTQFETSFESPTPSKATPAKNTPAKSAKTAPTAPPAAPAVAAPPTAPATATVKPKNSRASLCVPSVVPFSTSAVGPTAATASSSSVLGAKAVRFSLAAEADNARAPLLHSHSLPSSAIAATATAMPGPLSFSVRDTVTRERDRERERERERERDNKPLQMYSFLPSTAQDRDRPLGAAPKTRSLGSAARRMSVVGGATREREKELKTTSLLSTSSSSVKENESNSLSLSLAPATTTSSFVSASTAWGSVGRKRESVCVDLQAKRQRAVEDLPWAATATRKSSWR